MSQGRTVGVSIAKHIKTTEMFYLVNDKGYQFAQFATDQQAALGMKKVVADWKPVFAVDIMTDGESMLTVEIKSTHVAKIDREYYECPEGLDLVSRAHAGVMYKGFFATYAEAAASVVAAISRNGHASYVVASDMLDAIPADNAALQITG